MRSTIYMFAVLTLLAAPAAAFDGLVPRPDSIAQDAIAPDAGVDSRWGAMSQIVGFEWSSPLGATTEFRWRDFNKVVVTAYRTPEGTLVEDQVITLNETTGALEVVGPAGRGRMETPSPNELAIVFGRIRVVLTVENDVLTQRAPRAPVMTLMRGAPLAPTEN